MNRLSLSGALVAAFIIGAPGTVSASFSGLFDISRWTLADAAVGGSVNTADSPASIILSGGDQTVGGDTDFTILVPYSGSLRFDWSYVTTDLQEIALFDAFGYLVNGAFTILPDTNVQQGTLPQTGAVGLWLNDGDRFGFRIETDGYLGAATATVSNFEFAVPEPDSVGLLAFGLGLVASLTRRTRNARASTTA